MSTFEFVESPICADCGPCRNQELDDPADDDGEPHVADESHVGGEDANRG